VFFADNIALINEIREGVNTKLERWRDTLEVKGFRLSRSKTEYLYCRSSAGEGGVVSDVVIEGLVLSRVERFRDLGSIIQENGEIDKDINQWIKGGWQKRKRLTEFCVIRGSH